MAAARGAIAKHGLEGEVVVADNGSTDGSQELAAAAGARIVAAADRGYGSALRAGIVASEGRYVVMGDGDASYDFSALMPFVERMRLGADLVMGNRFRGGIRPGAMPFLHRWLGNPVLSWLGRLFFGGRVGDFHCGMRGFTREAFDRMELHTAGMEFASEMVVRASLLKLRIDEVPVVLHPAGRSRAPHLRTWRDGWRHLRFLLVYSPRWLFLTPGLTLFVLGAAVSLWLLPGPRHVGALGLDIHTLLIASMASLVGYQLVVFAVFTKVFAVREGFHPVTPGYSRLFRYFNLEVGLLAGLLMTVVGVAALVAATLYWGNRGFGSLDPRVTMRVAIPAVMLIAAGTQTIFASFFLSILGIRTRRGAG